MAIRNLDRTLEATRPGQAIRPATVSDACELFGFLMVPKFSLMAFASTIEPLRAANRIAGKKHYDWRFISPDGNPVIASNGLSVSPQASMEESFNLRNVVVCGGVDSNLFEDKSVFAWLRRLDRQGARVGSISDGTWILARAGLLDSYRCTVHWQYLDSFRETFPELEVTNELFEIDRTRFTCSGGTAALDLTLTLIGERHGRELATEVAENFIHERIRSNSDQQRMALRIRLGASHPKLVKVVELMEHNLEQPLSCVELAHDVGLSTRQLERLFRKFLGKTPTRYYMDLRLHRARYLLTQTTMSVVNVAFACGFVSASHFAKCYREHYKRPPFQDRMA